MCCIFQDNLVLHLSKNSSVKFMLKKGSFFLYIMYNEKKKKSEFILDGSFYILQGMCQTETFHIIRYVSEKEALFSHAIMLLF